MIVEFVLTYWPLVVSIPLWAALLLFEYWATNRRNRILKEFEDR